MWNSSSLRDVPSLGVMPRGDNELTSQPGPLMPPPLLIFPAESIRVVNSQLFGLAGSAVSQSAGRH